MWRRRAGSAAGTSGLSTAEAAVWLAVLAVVTCVAIPNLDEARHAAALRAAAGRLRGLMFRCRAVAVMQQRATGLVFERRLDGSWRCFIAQDGDGDGIRRRDIDRGVDPVISEILAFAPQDAGLGILSGEFVPDPSGRGRLRGDADDPVRAGRGDIITFTPQGRATPCSVYLTDRRARMRVLRIYGASGRVIQLSWQSGWTQWRPSSF